MVYTGVRPYNRQGVRRESGGHAVTNGTDVSLGPEIPNLHGFQSQA